MNSSVLDEIVRRVVEVAQPERIILFGSAARGQMGTDSDFDLLVVKSGVPHRGHLADQIYRKLFGVAVPVDVIVVTPEDIERYRDKVGTIIGPALQEGAEIYSNAEYGKQAENERPEVRVRPPELPDMTNPAEWLRRARSNLAVARLGRDLSDVLYEDLCFQAQQAAEKAIKSLLVQRQFPFPKTHVVTDLLTLVEQSGIEVPEEIRQADQLTKYAILTRYPGFSGGVTEEDYNHAIELADRVFQWAESLIRAQPKSPE